MSKVNTIIPILNLLIETCNSGAKGFHSAANAVDNPHYRRLLEQFAQQRRRFATTLSRIVRTYGGQPEHGETPFLAATHRNWLGLRAYLSKNRTWAVLDECERGESVAMTNYRKALADTLPEGIRPIVDEQFAIIQSTYERVRALRDLAHRKTDDRTETSANQ